MSTCMMAIEGILGDRQEFSVNMQQNDEGSRLFFALQQWYRMVLVTNEPDPDKINHWVRSNGLAGHAAVEAGPAFTSGSTTVDHRALQLRGLRSSRTAVGLVIDTDSLTIAMAMAQGITGLLYASPRIGTTRTDLNRPRRDWEAIVAEQEFQANSRPMKTAETGA